MESRTHEPDTLPIGGAMIQQHNVGLPRPRKGLRG